MEAMILDAICDLSENSKPLKRVQMDAPKPSDNELLLKVSACGVCHTELDEIEGRTPPPRLPVILGHQAVGWVMACGTGAKRFKEGDRLGVAWINSACGECELCQNGQENLCADFSATGRDANGGYAQYMTVDENFAHPIPSILSDVQAAPLLCAGAIGYRSLNLTNLKDGDHLGLTGFGASAHLVLKLVKHKFPCAKVYVFARSQPERRFACELGAVWAGDTTDTAPVQMNAIIDTTPVWKPVVYGLENLKPGGRLVINAIRKEEIDKKSLLEIDYPKHLWMEKEIKSVANVTRADVSDFLALAAEIPIEPAVETYKLYEANQALMELKQRKIRGAKVLEIE